ncbi:ABC transporter permease subunit, partial [Xanthomonas perforans]
NSLNYREGIPYAIIMFALCIVFELIATSVRSTLLGVQPTGRGLGSMIARRRKADRPAAAIDPLKQPWTPARRRMAGFSRSTIVVILLSLAVISTALPNFSLFLQNTGIAINRMLPPTIAEEKWGSVAEDFLITVQVGLAATILGVALSIVFGVLAARNVAPNDAVRRVFRFGLVLNRGVPELLLAFLFIILTGLGPTAGVAALAIGGVGLLGKLIADSLEEVDPGPERALRATGATRVQIFFAATLPQAAPAIVGHVLYLLDTNVRASTLLGVIGGAGIGYTILTASRINHQEMLALLIVMVFVVLAIEALSSLIRSLVK